MDNLHNMNHLNPPGFDFVGLTNFDTIAHDELQYHLQYQLDVAVVAGVEGAYGDGRLCSKASTCLKCLHVWCFCTSRAASGRFGPISALVRRAVG